MFKFMFMVVVEEGSALTAVLVKAVSVVFIVLRQNAFSFAVCTSVAHKNKAFCHNSRGSKDEQQKEKGGGEKPEEPSWRQKSVGHLQVLHIIPHRPDGGTHPFILLLFSLTVTSSHHIIS